MNLKKQFASVLTAAAVLGATPALPMSVVNAAGDTADQLVTTTTTTTKKAKAKTTPTKVTVKVTKTKTSKTVYAFQKVTLSLKGAKNFKSSNKKVATVSAKGVTFKKGAKKYTVTLTAKKATLTLSKSKVTVKAKKSYTVKAKTVKPANTVKWSTKNKKIATVKNGKITGKKKGTTYVYAKANGLTKSVKVTVK